MVKLSVTQWHNHPHTGIYMFFHTLKSEGKKTMRTRYTGIKETITRIFEIVEETASFYERVEGYAQYY